MIKTISLGKSFNKKWVLKDLNLNIKRGEFYCLLGPNGAGKTTTLKLLTGLLKPAQGKIYIGGIDIIANYLEAKKRIGFIPDTPFIYENLTAKEFLTFIGNIFGVQKKILEERINYYLNIFGLTEYEDHLLREYSHGMRQKIVYISSFIHNPEVLLVDEPLVGLDPSAIHLIKKMLKEEVNKGLTVLMCTHILSIAEELADRIGILTKGSLIAEGTLKELSEKISKSSLEEIFLSLTEENK